MVIKIIRIAAFPKCFMDELCVTRSITLFEWIEMASTLEVDGIELYDGFFLSFEEHYVQKVIETASQFGLEIPMLCYSPDFTKPLKADRLKEIQKQKKMIQLAKKLGCDTCRILSGQRRPNVDLDHGIKWVIESIKECLIFAEEFGIVLAMENHYKDGYWKFPEFAQKADIFLKIIEQIDSPWFGVQYDPSNAILAGDDPLWLLDKVKDRVVSMHASDRFLKTGTLKELKQVDGTLGYSPNLVHGEVGKGLNDYEAIFDRLFSVSYNGWISIEDGMEGLAQIKSSAEFLKRKIGGK